MGGLRNRSQNSLDEEEEGLPSARQAAGQQAVREAEPLLFARNKGEQAVSAERQHEGRPQAKERRLLGQARGIKPNSRPMCPCQHVST